MKKTNILLLIIALNCCALIQIQAQETWGYWAQIGEQDSGTYVNPIIPADYSDIDCIKVGDDYYAISSTFQFSPGMTILHSKDLVNWEIAGHAIPDITQISPELNWDRMNRYGKGVWAGSIRYHENHFYIYFGTPDEGYFTTSSPTPEGPWEPLTPLLLEPGWDDCTVMWDKNGEACFLGTHFADGYKTYLFKMSADGKKIDRKSAKLIYSGDGREANKLIHIGDWYYLVFSEYKSDKGRYVMARRSKKMMGPYIEEKQLALPSYEAHEPNQGGIVEGKDGRWHFLTHHGNGDWSGRIVSLLPVTWVDEWPLIGQVLPEGIGTMQWKDKMPILNQERLAIQRSDEFQSDKLSPQWQWNYQPRSDMFSLQERPGWLRLKAFRPLRPNQLLSAGNTLSQRVYRLPANDVVCKLDIRNMTDGQRCGICHFSNDHSSFGIVKEDGLFYLFCQNGEKEERGPQLTSPIIWLSSRWGSNGLSRYYFSTDGVEFSSFSSPYQLVWGNYRGDRIGIFCYNNLKESGFVDIDYFHYTLPKNIIYSIMK